jgi:predicted ArsR family transcriptional regulator
MSSADDTDFTPQERAARLTFTLVNGGRMTSREVAEDLGMTMHGARRLLSNVSRVVPIAPDERGVWRLLA